MQAHQHILQSLKSRPPHEIEYFDKLFDRCRDGDASVSGGAAVAFFKESNLSTVSLLEMGLTCSDIAATEGDLELGECVEAKVPMQRRILDIQCIYYDGVR